MLRRVRRLAVVVCGVGALIGASLAGGCAAYVNYPPIDQDVAVNDPNIAPTPDLCAAALEEVLTRYPIDGLFVINLPEGMRRSRADGIAAWLEPDRARIPGPGNEGLPVVHVSRVWVRGDRAEVDVLRPMAGAPQPVTVRFKNGFAGWTVLGSRTWPVGAIDAPPVYSWPEDAPEPAPSAEPVPEPPVEDEPAPAEDAGTA